MGSKRLLLAQRRLDASEGAYVATLKAALRDCADGRWGLFGQNPMIDTTDRYRPASLDDLRAFAAEIDKLRVQLGRDPFPLHARFESLRGRSDENQVGEPKIAAQLLAELEEQGF